jgi:Pyruvate/2-oxoacid:ferredoxin oxidoreductase delta subunit
VVLTAADHRALVEEGLSILHSVNDTVNSDGEAFVLVGDADAETMKPFWYKVRCTVCGDLFLLCPAKKNLRGNLVKSPQRSQACKGC